MADRPHAAKVHSLSEVNERRWQTCEVVTYEISGKKCQRKEDDSGQCKATPVEWSQPGVD